MASYSSDYLIKKSDTAEKNDSGQKTALKLATEADLNLLLMLTKKKLNSLPIIHVQDEESLISIFKED